MTSSEPDRETGVICTAAGEVCAAVDCGGDVVERGEDGRYHVRHIVREGPTGLIITRTRSSRSVNTRLFRFPSRTTPMRAALEARAKLGAVPSSAPNDRHPARLAPGARAALGWRVRVRLTDAPWRGSALFLSLLSVFFVFGLPLDSLSGGSLSNP